MPIYLDIDMDYFVKPIYKESINNNRIYKDCLCSTSSVLDFYEKLKKKLDIPKEKNIFTNHKKSYIYWWMKQIKNNTLIHIDAHSDLYRNRNMDLRYLNNLDMNCDDYIWYAIRDCFINEIYWVYPEDAICIKNEQDIYKMLGKDIVNNYEILEDVIKIDMKIVDYYGKMKEIKYNILNIDKLPKFNNEVLLLTLATSPEFIPKSADFLIDDLNSVFHFNEQNVLYVKNQHKKLLDI